MARYTKTEIDTCDCCGAEMKYKRMRGAQVFVCDDDNCRAFALRKLGTDGVHHTQVGIRA